MSLRVTGVTLISDNPAPFASSYRWRITVEAQDALPDPCDIIFSWADIEKPDKDVILDELEVGPFAVGKNVIEVDCDAPELEDLDPTKILDDMCIGVSFKYRGKDFTYAGFQVRPRWADPKHEIEMPEKFTADLLVRELISSKRYLKSMSIDWGISLPEGQQVESDGPAAGSADDDEEAEEEPESEADAAEEPTADNKRDRDGSTSLSQPTRSQPKAQ